MSHPAASIKSIFSGKVNLTDTEQDEIFDLANSELVNPDLPDRVLVDVAERKNRKIDKKSDGRNQKFEETHKYERNQKHEKNQTLKNQDDGIYGFSSKLNLASYNIASLPDFPDPEYEYRNFTQGSDNYSVSLKNLRIMALQKGASDNFEIQSSSTNISLASSESDYQQAFNTDQEYLLDSSQRETGNSEALEISRPVSRNSTTSCLSTTATKDGVEGKKLHRHGPTPYFSNVIANMISHQHQNPAVSQRAPEARIDRREEKLVSSSASAES